MCDTFVVLPSKNSRGPVIFGKNSDREANEAQILEYHPARDTKGEKKVQCTYISVPQVKETRAVLLSRPFWMWGAEMGTNEKGVVIGNEAVFSWVPVKKKGVLTGMDMIRLALERSDNAESALEQLLALQHDHGQGGIGGYRDKTMAYHNSFLIADPAEAWVLEMVGHLWAARKVKEHYAISNGLTLGEEYDRAHPEIISFARKHGKMKKGETFHFHFARSYSDWFYTTFSAGRRRRERALSLIQGRNGDYRVTDAMAHLRDHVDGNYRPDTHFLGNRLCAHAANSLSRNASQTCGSFIARLKPGDYLFWATGTAAPCTSLFKPIRFGRETLPPTGDTGAYYNPQSLWWNHERLHRLILKDFRNRSARLWEEQAAFEKKWIQAAEENTGDFFRQVTLPAFEEADRLTRKWIRETETLPVHNPPRPYYRRYWNKLNRQAKIPVTF